MANTKQGMAKHSMQRFMHSFHHEHQSDGLEIRNGLFRHVLSNKQGRLVCVKLYANGWSITTTAGTVYENVRLNGNEIEISPAGNIRRASLVLSEYVPKARPQRVDKVLVDTVLGQIEMRNDKDSALGIFLNGERVGSLVNPDKRSARYELPDSISLADAAILYCIGMMAIRYDDIDIV